MEKKEYPALDHINKLLNDNIIPPLEGELAELPFLQDIHRDIKTIREAVYAFSSGDLSSGINARGIIPGCLKTLQAHLRHMIWQVQMVEQGDFTQEVQFLGEFSSAFNGMVSQFASTLKVLKQKEEILTALTDSLRNEIDLRTSAVEALRESESRFKYLACHDPLTGILNRRSFMERALVELKAAAIRRIPCGIVMMDIDHFKNFNDNYGHQAGDEALRHVVAVISPLLRKNDFLGRYGGEEFIFFFHNTNQKTGIAIAERIREALINRPLKLTPGEIVISASFGVAIAPEREIPGENINVEVLVHSADIALYQAKASGRNKVVCFEAVAEKKMV
jgi:diguanylate cyclase (GGDEF)-like protein